MIAIILAVLLVAALAAVARLAAWRSKMIVSAARVEEELRHGQAALDRIEAEKSRFESDLRNAESNLSLSREQIARIEADRDATIRAYDEARKRMEETFNSLARAELERTTQALRIEAAAAFRQRQHTIEEMLKPVRESLDRYTSIGEQIKGLHSFGEALKAETGQVVMALRGSSQARGAWGEMLLERLFEIAGLEENVHYRKQVSVSTESGMSRPDFVLSLPNQAIIVVDSKVALDAYLSAVGASVDDEQRAEAMARHARDVRKHLDSLRKKDYSALFDRTPEFVVMFLPSEGHLADAVRLDPMLLEYGVQSRVIPATPLTVWAILNGVALAWRHDQLARNAQEIVREASEMLNRLATMTTHVVSLRKHLDASVQAFDDFQGSLERRVLVKARHLVELGVRSAKEMPVLEQIERRPRDVGQPPDDETARKESSDGESV